MPGSRQGIKLHTFSADASDISVCMSLVSQRWLFFSEDRIPGKIQFRKACFLPSAPQLCLPSPFSVASLSTLHIFYKTKSRVCDYGQMPFSFQSSVSSFIRIGVELYISKAPSSSVINPVEIISSLSSIISSSSPMYPNTYFVAS